MHKGILMAFEPDEILVGERIELRKPEVSFAFAEKMFKAVDANREHILPWLGWAMPEHTKSAEDDFVFAFNSDKLWKARTHFEYVIYEKETDEFIGGAGVYRLGKEIDKTFEIGYWLVKSACGKGYMQEAVRLIEKMFFSLGAERLVIRNSIANIPSRCVAENLGYVFEGVQRHGHYCPALEKFEDTNVFSKLKDEYFKE